MSLIKSIEGKVEMNIIEKVIAAAIERVCGNYVTTIIGILVVLSATLGGAASAISTNLALYGINVHAGLVTAAAVILGVACILAKDSGVKLPTQVSMVFLALCMALMLPTGARAQASSSTASAAAPAAVVPIPIAAPASLFTATAEATAFHFNGGWSVANHTTTSFDLIDWGANKANSLAIEGHAITAPTPGYTIALGGVRVTPNLANLISKTNIPAGSFGIYLQGAAGATSAPTTHLAFLLGGGVQYRVSNTVTWSSLHVGYLRLGAQSAAEVSTGLQYFFK